MTGRIGADVGDMENLKSTFAQQAIAVEGLIRTLDQKVETTWWVGKSADTFKGAWQDTFKPALVRLNAELGNAAKEVGERAQALRAADSQG